MYTIAKRFEISASHQLDHLPTAHPCRRLHGHNYQVEVVLQRATLDETGFVVDYGRLDPVKRFLRATLDHRHLNDVVGEQPSAERLARWVFDWCCHNLEPEITEALVAVRVSETPATWAEYRP